LPEAKKTDTLREYFTPTRERYLTTQHERDTETGYDNRGARLYDADVMRFLSVDPLATKFLAWNPYQYATANPVNVIDPDGKDTIFVNRGALTEKYSDFNTNVWDLSITYMKDGVETPVQLGGFKKLYMMGSAKHEAPTYKDGFNFLKSGSYRLLDQRMEEHKSWNETFNVAGTNVYIHRGWNYSWFGGCKGICSGIDPYGYKEDFGSSSQAVDGQNGLAYLLMAYYKEKLSQLTGDKIILKVNNGNRNFDFAPVKSQSERDARRERQRLVQDYRFWNSETLDTFYED
jgi:RHS repeat-associated protein